MNEELRERLEQWRANADINYQTATTDGMIHYYKGCRDTLDDILKLSF